MITEEEVEKVYNCLDGTGVSDEYAAALVLAWVLGKGPIPQFLKWTLTEREEED